MKKIPTIFKRDPENMSRVLPEWNEPCLWVRDGEGTAIRKLDGTCCMVDENGALWKRRTVKAGKKSPEGFILCERDEIKGKAFGWVPATVGDTHHWEAYKAATFFEDLEQGTYELVGPKIQGNPEFFTHHVLISHAYLEQYATAPRDFDGLRSWLNGRAIEGLVFRHQDGRMAKIKLRDFGLVRGIIQ